MRCIVCYHRLGNVHNEEPQCSLQCRGAYRSIRTPYVLLYGKPQLWLCSSDDPFLPPAPQAGELFRAISVANWFTADHKLGSLSLHLDYPAAFHAEVRHCCDCAGRGQSGGQW